MSPSADFLRNSSTANRRIVSQLGPGAQPMALQRSEFEDFMNAYRPTLEVTRPEVAESSRTTSHDDSKADFGKSLKKLMKRTQTASPSVSNKNNKKDRVPPPPREKSVSNELKPAPFPQVKKASRPGSVIVESSNPLSIPLQPKPLTPPAVPEPKTSTLPKNGAKCKAQDAQQKLTSDAGPPSGPSCPSPASVKRRLSLQEQQKDMAMLMPSNQPPTPTNERDFHCLFIARNSLGRFLPPRRNPDPLLSLRIVEVPERKYRVILEFEESRAFQKPRSSNSGLVVASPDNYDYRHNSWDQMQAFSWIRESRTANSGVLLANVEKWTEFPYVTYLTVCGSRSELCAKVNQIRSRPLPLEECPLQFIAGYEEVVTVCRPPFAAFPEPSTSKTGFVVFLYQVFPGEDGLRFEQNWVMWTGARQLYSHAPEYMGLKRISILKSIMPTQIVIYAMLCEFSAIMEHLTEACVLVDQLRARCCGFTGIYRVLDTL